MGFGEVYGSDYYEPKKETKKDVSSGKKIESKEQYKPLKVYEVKNITDVGFGKNSKCSTDKHEMHFVVNGPLVGDDGQPVGGYIDNTTKVKDFVDPASGGGNFAIDNGIFGVGVDGKPYLIPYSDIKKNEENKVQFQWAFQNGPMLIQNGVNMREKGQSTSKNSRSGIGFTPEGKMIVIYSDQPVTFKEFAKEFKDRGCNNAIYLDGGTNYAGCADAHGSHGNLHPEAKKLQFFHQN